VKGPGASSREGCARSLSGGAFVKFGFETFSPLLLSRIGRKLVEWKLENTKKTIEVERQEGLSRTITV